MLTLKAGRFDVAALRRSGKNPKSIDMFAAHLQDRLRALGEKDATASVVRLSISDLDHTVLAIFPPQPEALFGPNTTIDQNGANVAQEVWVAWLDGCLAALCRPYADERPLIGLQCGVTDCLRAVKIRLLLVHADNSVTMRLTRQHAYAGHGSRHLSPFRGKCKYPPQDLQLAVHRGDLHPGVSPLSGVTGDFFARDRIQGFVSNGGVLQQSRGSILIVGKGFGLCRERGAAERQELSFGELSNRCGRLSFPNTDFALCE